MRYHCMTRLDNRHTGGELRGIKWGLQIKEGDKPPGRSLPSTNPLIRRWNKRIKCLSRGVLFVEIPFCVGSMAILRSLRFFLLRNITHRR